jgi:hypothetical protein
MPKLDNAPSNACRPGARSSLARGHGRAPRCGVRSEASVARRAQRMLRGWFAERKLDGSGLGRIHGCSCLRLVAEVSEDASSSRPRWRGREAESSGRGVARASRIPVTGMASLDRAKRVLSEARKPNKPTRRARLDRKIGQPTHRRRPGSFVPSPLTGWRSWMALARRVNCRA